MPSYNIRHLVTSEYRYAIGGASAEEACESLGWLIGDCHIEELVPPRNSKPPFVPTQYEREIVQHAIDLEGVGLSRSHTAKLLDTLRRWMEAQSWDV